MKESRESPHPGYLDAATPVARFLSNGTFTTLLTASGTGYSAIGELALTRWTGNRIEDEYGYFLYLRDLDSGAVWSAGYQPVGDRAEWYRSRWRPGVFEILRQDHGLECTVETCVAQGANDEIRRITIRNRSAGERHIELTTYGEIVLNSRAADAAHPVFSSLFIQTEREGEVLLARRRARAEGSRHPWMVHALSGEGQLEWETDRARFLGRNRSPASPLALVRDTPLSGTVGNVLDPVLSLRRRLRLPPGETARLIAVLGIGEDRSRAAAMAREHADLSNWDEITENAEAAETALLQELGLSSEEAERAQTLAGAILYGHPGLRAQGAALSTAVGHPDELRAIGVRPGPLAVVHAERAAAARQLSVLVRAHRYWRRLGLPIQLVVLTPEPKTIPDDARPRGADNHRILTTDSLRPEAFQLLDAVAHMVVTDEIPDPLSQSGRPMEPRRQPGSGVPAVPRASCEKTDAETADESLQFFNGTGGFSEDGREYVIRLRGEGSTGLLRPPLPWINVIANQRFGFLVSESGAGYTWSGNSREHRLTPWYNDPLRDPHGEALYIRDEEGGAFWSPLPGPVPDSAGYEMRHGLGYSKCRHRSHALEQETLLFASRLDPVKIVHLRLTNLSGKPRRLSLFSYQRLVLGGLPEESGRHVVTEWDPDSRALLARNRRDPDYSRSVAFSAVVNPEGPCPLQFTGDRESFIGRNGDPYAPQGVTALTALDNITGPGLDPCFAHQVLLDLPPEGSREFSFLLGEGKSRDEALSILARYRSPGAIAREREEATGFWQQALGGVEIETPVAEIDLMVNGWLSYQNLSCRMWGRSAFYQSGGAFGYRDQLQDAAAFVYLRPDLVRDQILLHAAHQFAEGDVLHWWHPPASRGLRTRFADDLLWLPLVTAEYLHSTGDASVLEERTRYLTARTLEPGEDEVFLEPADSGQEGSVYEHCCRALDRSLTEGPHGLPLFGTGDWNDSMNRVGREGRGESVWMGFFLYRILGLFLPICEQRGDSERLTRYREYCERLGRVLNGAGWDGRWFRRGYYDDGDPLGSSTSDECRIDALAQAWSVISKAAPPERAAQAMNAVEEHLISEEDGIIRLLIPPFENTPHDPGYIKGYVRGVRENGGQYTHAALWVVRALAELGRTERAAPLLTMLSPVSHARTPDEVDLYKIEPYVIAADVYGAEPHVGRGGWSWYTGSAGWMFRVALESVLGFTIRDGKTLIVKPCVPRDWPGYRIRYRVPGEETRYVIEATNPGNRSDSVADGTVDGDPIALKDGAAHIPLLRDGATHHVKLTLG